MFRTRLRELRENAGYKSQQAFADAFGVAQSTVGGWEAGKREPNYATTLKLANFFHVSVDYLLGQTDQKDMASTQTPTPTTGPSSSRENLQAAFWGGEKDLSQEDLDDMWNDVERFAAFLAEKKKQEKKECQTEEELIAELQKIQIPLLMLGGTADTVSPPELMVRTLKAVKGSRLVLFEGVEHQDLTRKCRKEYVEEIMAFCRTKHLI